VLVFSCGRSLYIDWRMVVVVGGGGVLHHVKSERELTEMGKCPRGICPRGECLTLQKSAHFYFYNDYIKLLINEFNNYFVY